LPTVGVVMPCRNEARSLVEVLNAVAGQQRQPDEVILVDDGSSDGTSAVVEEWRRLHPGFQLQIVPGPGRGVAAAVNAGIAALNADVVVRLDGHCRPAADYIVRAVALVTLPDVGVAGGVWLIEPGATSLEAEAIAIAAAHAFGSGGAVYRNPQASERIDVDTVPFGCFRRSLWETLGGLDEELESNEDYDFNFRVRQRGLRIVLDPGIRCTYYARPTVGALARQYSRYGWWKARMLVRHPRAVRWRQFIPALLVPALLAMFLGLVLGGSWGWSSLLAVYPAAILIGAAHAAATRGRWAAVGWIAGAFMTIQVTWSLAFCASLASAGLPRRAVRP
jgi:succinoglycan biosynthesis protein ExoA